MSLSIVPDVPDKWPISIAFTNSMSMPENLTTAIISTHNQVTVCHLQIVANDFK